MVRKSETGAGRGIADRRAPNVRENDWIALDVLRRAATRPGVSTAERLFRTFLDDAERGRRGVRTPALAAVGSAALTRDERRLLRAIGAARASDDALLDNYLYAIALDPASRARLAAAVCALAAMTADAVTDPLGTGASQVAQLVRGGEDGACDWRDDRIGSARPELPMPETAVLWAMRTWVAAARRHLDPARFISPVLSELGAPDATGYLCGMMWAISHGASRKLAVRCPCHGSVTEDEQALLDALALTQQQEIFERLLLLRTLLRPQAATPVGQSVSGLVRSLNRAGLFLTPAFETVRRHAFVADAQPDRC